MQTKIEKAELPWKEAILLVCTKCGKKLQANESELNPAETLKAAIKIELQRHGKTIRVVNSGCLDICPDDRIAIALATEASKPSLSAITVSSETSAPEILEFILPGRGRR